MTDATAEVTAALTDRYRIERELGAGGMATVYLAEDLKHHRQVAIKVLRPELAAVIGAERFLREIQMTANLQHPHILGLIDSGVAEVERSRGQEGERSTASTASFLVYYVMPFVDGESLRDRLTREKQLPIGEAVRIATEVASALDYAHRHGVVHRDIKPEAVMLQDDHALVADFGIGKALSSAESDSFTQAGTSVGTPAYMRPEQAAGDVVDGRSDLYSLGCALYEMLAGHGRRAARVGGARDVVIDLAAGCWRQALSAERSARANVARRITHGRITAWRCGSLHCASR